MDAQSKTTADSWCEPPKTGKWKAGKCFFDDGECTTITPTQREKLMDSWDCRMNSHRMTQTPTQTVRETPCWAMHGTYPQWYGWCSSYTPTDNRRHPTDTTISAIEQMTTAWLTLASLLGLPCERHKHMRCSHKPTPLDLSTLCLFCLIWIVVRTVNSRSLLTNSIEYSILLQKPLFRDPYQPTRIRHPRYDDKLVHRWDIAEPEGEKKQISQLWIDSEIVNLLFRPSNWCWATIRTCPRRRDSRNRAPAKACRSPTSGNQILFFFQIPFGALHEDVLSKSKFYGTVQQDLETKELLRLLWMLSADHPLFVWVQKWISI